MNEETKVGDNTSNELVSVEDTSVDTEHGVGCTSTESKASGEEAIINEGDKSKDLTCENREQTEQVQNENAKTEEDDLDLFDVTNLNEVVPKRTKIKNLIKRYVDIIELLVLGILLVWSYFEESTLFLLSICFVFEVLLLLVRETRGSTRLDIFKLEDISTKERLLTVLGSVFVFAGFILAISVDSILTKLCFLWSFILLRSVLSHLNIKVLKKEYIYIVYGILLLMGVLFYSNKEYKYSALSEADRVQSYVESFTSGDYSKCDKIANTKDEKLLPENEESVGTFSKGLVLYENMLSKLSSSIKSVEYDSQKDILTVTYQPYSKIKKVKVDEKVVSDLVEKYVTNQLSDQDLKLGIEDIYLKSFDSMFSEDKDVSVQTQNIELSIGNKTIKGFKSGIVELLKNTNISHNVGVFEKDIQSTLNVELRK